MDWNEDGKKDLITGERDGFIRIYLNTNTDEEPIFNGYDKVKLGGIDFDCGSTSVPCIVDWNNDGKKDLLCGEDNGKIFLLINEGTNAVPLFNSSVFLKEAFNDIDVGTRASPTVVDWNRDGNKDLIVGETYGNLFYFENRGTDLNPQFNGSVLLAAGGVTIDIGTYSRPDVADWDNDGVMDILCGDYINTTAYVDYFHAQGRLYTDENQVSESAGGTSHLYMKAGPDNGSRNYLILGSVSGSSPGFDLPGGEVLPLNWDLFTDILLSLLNTPTCADFMGTLDASGKATATLDIIP
ncbi:MAG: VCBS repeat-containing protein, partial [Planctomycetota bacterium]